MAEQRPVLRVPTKGLNVIQIRDLFLRGRLKDGQEGCCWAKNDPGAEECRVCWDADLCAMDKRSLIDHAIASEPVLKELAHLPGLVDEHPAPIPPAAPPPPQERRFKVPTAFDHFHQTVLGMDDVQPWPRPSCFYYVLRRRKLIGVISPSSVESLSLVIYHCTAEELEPYDVPPPGGRRLIWVGDKDYPGKPMLAVKLNQQDQAIRIARGAHRLLRTKLAIYVDGMEQRKSHMREIALPPG